VNLWWNRGSLFSFLHDSRHQRTVHQLSFISLSFNIFSQLILSTHLLDHESSSSFSKWSKVDDECLEAVGCEILTSRIINKVIIIDQRLWTRTLFSLIRGCWISKDWWNRRKWNRTSRNLVTVGSFVLLSTVRFLGGFFTFTFYFFTLPRFSGRLFHFHHLSLSIGQLISTKDLTDDQWKTKRKKHGKWKDKVQTS